MKIVQPIRSREKIEAMKTQLKKNSTRDYLLFVIGINVGLRVSDLLTLKVGDVRGRDFFIVKEQKTDKTRRVFIKDAVKREIMKHTQDQADREYLFQSRKGDNKPIGRVQAYVILNKAAAAVGLDEIGTHTLRKTYGYWHYQQNKDIAALMIELNHSNQAVTMKYVGISDDIRQQCNNSFVL